MILPAGFVIQVTALLPDDTIARQEPVPPKIAALLTEFWSVFAPPAGYPPARDCDNAIPLIPGASPFSVRPYHYPPLIKDEIERQVTEMLQSGIIQPSSSPFSSSVLLVKKKDGTYHFEWILGNSMQSQSRLNIQCQSLKSSSMN